MDEIDRDQAQTALLMASRRLLDALSELDETLRLDAKSTSKKYVAGRRAEARKAVGPARRALAAAVVKLESDK